MHRGDRSNEVQSNPGRETSTDHRPASSSVTIRPFAEGDRPFFQRVVGRLHPGHTVSPRDPAAMAEYFRRIAAGEAPQPSGTDTFVAVGADGAPLGLIAIFEEKDYFTGHPRAYVEMLVVDEAAEGRGVGRALMGYAEGWARQHGCAEVVLDVFADNQPARAFYERLGYRPDHLRMAKPLGD